MATSPTEIQQESRDQWLEFDRQLRDVGICGGLPYGVFDFPIETRSEPMQKLIGIMLDTADAQGMETWRTQRKKNAHEDDSNLLLVNSWVCSRAFRNGPGQVKVLLYKGKETGRAQVEYFYVLPELDRLAFLISTHDVRWKSSFMAAELKAREKLDTILTPIQQLSYTLSDCFLEKGRGSGNTYLVRKNRPTIAFGYGGAALCALCLHPLAYYTGTWAGVMPPSDEVWTHLNYIRTDEVRYWRRANQIPFALANSGV